MAENSPSGGQSPSPAAGEAPRKKSIFEITSPSGKQAQSFTIRAKKFVSSKTLDTKLGRKWMLHNLGQDGNRLFSFMEIVASKHFGENKAKEMEKNMLKLIMKTQMTLNANGFGIKESRQVQNPIHDVCFELIRLLKISPGNSAKDESGTSAAPEEAKKEDNETSPFTQNDLLILQKRLLDALNLWEALMNEHLSHKNSEMMDGLINPISNLDFIEAILKSPELEDPSMRKELKETLINMTNEFMIMVGQPNVFCHASTCGKEVVRPSGLFVGSKYCRKHHSDHYDRIAINPRLKDFVDVIEHRRYMKDHLASQRDSTTAGSTLPQQEFQIILLISDFQNSFKADERLQIAEQIIQGLKNASENGKNISPDMVNNALKNYELALQESRLLPRTLWDDVNDHFTIALEQEIMPGFRKSAQFLRFTMSHVKLPPPPKVIEPTPEKNPFEF